MISWAGLGFQNLITKTNIGLDFFHDLVLFLLIIILAIVLLQIFSLISNREINLIRIENSMLERIWTFIPGLILVCLGIPRLHTLYITEASISDRILCVKVVGHQWYWRYEVGNNLSFDSYIIPTSDLTNYGIRLLEVDNILIVPIKVPTRIIISSTDVIHRWALPSIGIKIDCTPGRLNQVVINFSAPVVAYGQCREICGSNHSFIPIKVVSVPLSTFKPWIDLIKE